MSPLEFVVTFLGGILIGLLIGFALQAGSNRFIDRLIGGQP